jgi:hypothetical protein
VTPLFFTRAATSTGGEARADARVCQADPRSRRIRGLAFHGLLHKLVGEPWLVATFGERPSVQVAFVYALAVLAVSYLLGFCSYHLFEKHFLRLKGFFAGP